MQQQNGRFERQAHDLADAAQRVFEKQKFSNVQAPTPTWEVSEDERVVVIHKSTATLFSIVERFVRIYNAKPYTIEVHRPDGVERYTTCGVLPESSQLTMLTMSKEDPQRAEALAYRKDQTSSELAALYAMFLHRGACADVVDGRILIPLSNNEGGITLFVAQALARCRHQLMPIVVGLDGNPLLTVFVADKLRLHELNTLAHKLAAAARDQKDSWGDTTSGHGVVFQVHQQQPAALRAAIAIVDGLRGGMLD